MRKAAMLLLSIVLIGGCAVNKPITKEEMSKFPTAISLAESLKPGLFVKKKFSKQDYQDRHVAVLTYENTIDEKRETGEDKYTSNIEKFITDFAVFCDSKAGTFKDIRKENSQKLASLTAKYTQTYNEESKYFECGPEGRGTRSDDWTKFNPSICRKLYDTKKKVDYDKVKTEYGRPAAYGCITGDNEVLFMGFFTGERIGYTKPQVGLSGTVYSPSELIYGTNITIIEGKNGPLPASELMNMNIVK